MSKTKRFLKILAIIILIIIILIGIVAFYIYQKFKWVKNAEPLGGVIFGTPMFNERLKSCIPSFAGGGSYFNEPWEIHGLEDEKCTLVFNKLVTRDVEQFTKERELKYREYKCKLPYEVYSNPDDLDWDYTFNSEYCR